MFGFDEENEKAFVITAKGFAEAYSDEAIETCPVECIHWESMYLTKHKTT